MPSIPHTSSAASEAPRIPRWLIVGTALAMLALSGNIFIDVYNTRQLGEDNRWVAHTQDVIAGLEQVLSLAKDAETGQRGYIITGQDPYLEPYETAVREIDKQIIALQSLTADSPFEQQRWPKLREMVTARISRLANGIELRKTGDFTAAQQFILSGEGKQQMDELRRHIAELVHHERTLLADRQQQARKMQASAVTTGIAAGLLTLAMIIGLLVALRKHLLARAAAAFAIAEQGERWRTTLASIGDGVITTDLGGRVAHMNSVAEALTGWTSAAAAGQLLTDVFNIVNEATRQPVANPAIRSLTEGVIVGLANHTVLISRDGSERPIDDSAAPIRCKDGEIVGCVLVFRDVSDRSKSERALRRSEQQLRAIYDGTNEYIGLLEPHGKLLQVNRASLKFIRGEPDQVVGKYFWDTPWFTSSPGAPERIRQAVDAAARGETDVFEIQLTSPTGEQRWFEASFCPILSDEQEVVLIVPEARDITARKTAEQDQSRLAAIVSSSDDAIISKDLSGRILTWNRGAERMFGYAPADAVGQSIKTIVPSNLHAEEDDILGRLARGESIDHYETTRITKDGAPIRVSLSVSPLKDADGKIVGASTIARDITASKRMEEQLRRSEELYRRIGESIDYGVWICDAAGRNTYASDSFLKLVGLTQEQASNLGWANVLHPDEALETVAAWKECVRTGCLWDREHRFRGVDGNWHYMLARGVPVRNERGEIDCWVGINLDISRIKKAEEDLRRSEERFRLAADAAQALIYDVDLESGKASTVHGLQQIIGFDPSEVPVTREWWHSRIHPTDLTAHLQKIQQALVSDDRYRDEYRVRHANGKWIYVEDAGQIVRDAKSKSLRLTGSILDVTERKRVEDTLREADRRKDEFLAMLAHELRNPLAPIRNALQILKLADGREQVGQAHDVMERQFNQLVRLVDDLLDVSRVNLGKIELRREQVELKSIIQHAVETSRPAIEASQHELQVSLPPQRIVVNGDPHRLAQVFSNLLNNSCKYSPPRSKICLSVERRNETVVASVKDSGVGIAPEKLAHIFEIFTQVDSSLDRSQGGLGVGLALVQRLVELHGGSVTAMSDGLGKGSEFVIRLPIAVDNAVQPAPAARPAKNNAKLRILVVDDNRDSAKTMAMMLKLLGHTTETAHDGEEALGTAEAFQPNVVLLDIGLPKLNGFEVAKRIREQNWGRSMFLAAMTGWGQDEDRRKSQEAGFNTHLVKPVDLATLTRLLAQQPAAKS